MSAGQLGKCWPAERHAGGRHLYTHPALATKAHTAGRKYSEKLILIKHHFPFSEEKMANRIREGDTKGWPQLLHLFCGPGLFFVFWFWLLFNLCLFHSFNENLSHSRVKKHESMPTSHDNLLILLKLR